METPADYKLPPTVVDLGWNGVTWCVKFAQGLLMWRHLLYIVLGICQTWLRLSSRRGRRHV